ncbi:CUB and sushi domain-containing protein 3-like isoform X2 [Hemitrygon akajei]|uniref:CUB and sushi domain-containing protein 3-like isoform X2 n=1 Tax=Hemitrygon akajei TaxID=2704970 RepID=UPI003BF98CCE
MAWASFLVLLAASASASARVTTRSAGVDCGNPEEIENGVFVAPSTVFGSVAVYQCNEGYRMSGGGVRICGSSGWTGQAPTCTVSTAAGILNEMITFGHELINKEENVIKSYYQLLERERELLRSKEKLLHEAEQYVNQNIP